MGITTEIHVDPSLDASPQVGDGSLGSPYSNIHYAIEQTTPAADVRFNIKAGATQVLDEQLATTYANAGWASAQVSLAGYSSVPGDGGRATVDCNGGEFFNSASWNNVEIRDLIIHNYVTTSGCVRGDDACHFANLEVYNGTGPAISMDQSSIVFGCYVHDVTVSGSDQDVVSWEEGVFMFNRIEGGCTNGIESLLFVSAGNIQNIRHNIFVLTTAGGDCIQHKSSRHTIIDSNSFYNSSGSVGGSAINKLSSGDLIGSQYTNNLFEGFALGIEVAATSRPVRVGGGNSFFNCTANDDFDDDTRPLRLVGPDETLTESPFVDAAGGDFAPKNVGSVYEGHLPTKIAGDFF